MNIVKIAQSEPNLDLVDLLTDMLDDALAGKLRSIAGVVMYQTENTQVFWATDVGCRPVLMLGAIVNLQHDYAARIAELRDQNGAPDTAG